jgi:hypothetical protein
MEDQLFQAKRAMEDRAKASTRLQDRLAKIEPELKQYRERYGRQNERQNKNQRLVEKSRSSRSRSLSPGGKERLENEQVVSCTLLNLVDEQIQ